MSTLVKIENVKKTYIQGEIKVYALRGVDYVIDEGAFLAFAGPSGSGKTTLLNLIGGLDAPSEGDIYIGDKRLNSLSGGALSDLRLHHIGFIFQDYNLIPVLTAYENAEFVLLLQGKPADERKQLVMEMLRTVGLEGMEHRYPRELSGGQQQRVAIARAIVASPKIILADEPTANLDSKTAANLLDTMQKLNQDKNATFIFSTHDPAVMKRAQTLVNLKDGQIENVEQH